ncbi:MAG: hypothetical protein K2R98_24290 [Gemmataceae bacterium]|nr:hypothetical protein [Gemmataceae bacterium]
MTRVVVNAKLRSQLPDLSQPIEFCDESGHVIARAFPVLHPAEYGPLDPQISDEELRRREQSNEKRYTTAEMLDYLRKL